MSTLRTYNLQNPDSASVNIELTSDGGAVAAGIVTATTLNATTITGVSTAGITTAYINTLSGISTISADAAISINQNLVFPSGKGIDFSATTDGSGTTTSELLDDYEEGTWDFAITTTGGSVTMSSSNNACWYIKIGRIVHVGGQVVISSVSSPTGAIIVTLPFTTANLSESAEYNAGAITISSSVSKNTNDFALLVQDNGEMRIYVADAVFLSSTNANAQQLQANSSISFQLTYVAA